MIIVDTNLISEVMRYVPEPKVMLWYRTLPRARLFTTSITVAEIFAGIGYLPAGRRRTAMQEDAQAIFEGDLSARILPFDLACARHYAEISASRRERGKPIKPLDAQIAAVAKTHGMTLATRNTKDFEDCGVDLINPWEV